jgi:RNA polymerase primary sigma factor
MPVTATDQFEAPDVLIDRACLAEVDDALENDLVLDPSLFEEDEDEDEEEEKDDAVDLTPAPSEADELDELRRGRWRGKSDKSPQTPLETYLREINETSLLSAADEQELAGRIAQGDAEARDRMVRANLRLVVNIARGYSGKGLGLQDLIEEGNLGLLRAVEGFDPHMGTRFSTYASYWIKQSIKRALINSAKTIRIPAYMVELLSKWRRANTRLSEELGRTPTHEEIARVLGLPKKKLPIIKKAIRIYNSTPQTDQAEVGWSLGEMVMDERMKSPEDELLDHDVLSSVLQMIEHLDEREATVLRMRFGLGDMEPHTLKEIGEALNLTRERVRQIETEALQRLADGLKDPRERMWENACQN